MTADLLPRPVPPEILDADPLPTATVGCIDAVTDDIIFGWAWCPADPDHRVELEIVAGTTVLATVTADQQRDDLAANGVGDGRHAFTFHYRNGPATQDGLSVRVKATGQALPLVAQAADASRAATIGQALAAQREEMSRLAQALDRHQDTVIRLAARLSAVEANATAAEGFLLRFDETLKALPAPNRRSRHKGPKPATVIALSVAAGFAGGLVAGLLAALL